MTPEGGGGEGNSSRRKSICKGPGLRGNLVYVEDRKRPGVAKIHAQVKGRFLAAGQATQGLRDNSEKFGFHSGSKELLAGGRL